MMPQRYAELVRRVRENVLGPSGYSEPGVRVHVEAYAARHGQDAESAAASVPEALRGYVDKVARFAYRVTDEDVQALKRAGYSEDAIFEITVSAALGAGMHRLERGIAALKGLS
jgi:alkylhydroperoxidase family enzyme